MHPHGEGNERESFAFRVFWAFMGDSPGRRKATAAAGEGEYWFAGHIVCAVPRRLGSGGCLFWEMEKRAGNL